MARPPGASFAGQSRRCTRGNPRLLGSRRGPHRAEMAALISAPPDRTRHAEPRLPGADSRAAGRTLRPARGRPRIVSSAAPPVGRDDRTHMCSRPLRRRWTLVYCDCRTPRAVFTDLTMPKIDGQGLARWLKARYPSVPIVLVTGQHLDEFDLAVLQNTFVAVLKKPIDIPRFLAVLTELMPTLTIPTLSA